MAGAAAHPPRRARDGGGRRLGAGTAPGRCRAGDTARRSGLRRESQARLDAGARGLGLHRQLTGTVAAHMTLEGRVALVTGGGRGIGKAIALGLAADGADVAINYRRDEEAARETVGEIEGLGRKAAAYKASIDDVDEDQAMVDAALETFGHIDILVNNAGIASRGGSVAKTDPAEVVRVIGSHAIGAHHLCRMLVPQMRQQERGD